MLNRSIILSALLLAGCGVNPPKYPRADPYQRGQIHVDSEQLRDDTAVGTPIVTRDAEGNLVHVTVPIRSAIDKTLYVDYWVTFFDKNGQQISKLFLGTKTLQANTPDMITFNSMSPRAADFQLDLRYAR
ncbi:MAG: DUF1425 domain-containing protein [Tepidisphaeraceae bacterium]